MKKIGELAESREERLVQVGEGEIQTGKPLPWDVYDAKGVLLMDAGTLIESEEQARKLSSEGNQRKIGGTRQVNVTPVGKDPMTGSTSNPFARVDEFLRRLNGMLKALIKPDDPKAMEKRVLRFAEGIQELVGRDVDAALGACHLVNQEDYVVNHTLYVALLSELVARRLEKAEPERRSLVAASLTANLAMLGLQRRLVAQAEPLTEEQRQAIHDHPARAVKHLRNLGVEDDLWLEIILQHHERLDGGGYPRGLKGEAFIEEARVMAIADRYHAMISGRKYRKGLMPREALRKLFMEDGQVISADLAQLFIKEVGFFPPGSFVKLANGEAGLVIRRGGQPMTPEVAALASEQGRFYAQPLRRDTSQSEFAIKGMGRPPSHIPFNVPYLWGYREL
ncbi:MAG: HD-GYP domain-containing protein [Pseudomonadota bacterium]